MSDLSGAASESRQRFLDGHMTPALERHCLNVGRVAVEFACLEEDVGHLVVDLETPGGGSDTAYMAVVRFSNDIPKRLRSLARKVDGSCPLDLGSIAADYERFKAERDRYAHSSVGGTLSSDAESGRLTLRTMQQKHARGDEHPKGQVSELPSDDEIDQLCRDMRAVRQSLQDARASRALDRFFENLNRPAQEVAQQAARRVTESIGEALRPTIARLSSIWGGRSGDAGGRDE